jgi:hypothetical protein
MPGALWSKGEGRVKGEEREGHLGGPEGLLLPEGLELVDVRQEELGVAGEKHPCCVC